MQTNINNNNLTNLPTEDEIEAEAQSQPGIMGKMIKLARCERRRFIYMAVIFFIIAYIYAITREMKDAIVIERLGPASIPYLKTLVVLPVNMLVICLIQANMVNKSVSTIFSQLSFIFGVFFCIYGSLLIPMKKYIEFDEFIIKDFFTDGKMEYIGLEWTKAFLLTINLWTTSLFYLSAELWGAIVLQFLFFSFLNEICTHRQSLRFTPLIMIFANLSLIVSGITMKTIKKMLDYRSYSFNIIFSQLIFVFLGILSIGLYFITKYFENYVMKNPLFFVENKHYHKNKTKIGFIEGIWIILRSKLVLAMSFVVIAYSISVNLVESSFKSCMNIYAIKNGLNISSHVIGTQSDIQLYVGVFAIILLISSFPTLIKKRGFGSIAFIPPIFCMIGMSFIFTLSAYNVSFLKKQGFLKYFSGKFGENLWLEQIIGVIVLIGYKLLKYAAFDLSKEALSMKIDPIYRSRFKSIYDGMCGKIGKAAGSGIVNIESIIYNTVDVREASVTNFIFVTILIVFWILTVKYLSFKYDQAVLNKEFIEIDCYSDNNKN